MTSAGAEFIVDNAVEARAVFAGLAAYLFQRVTPGASAPAAAACDDRASPVFECRFAASLAPLTPVAPSVQALHWLAQLNYRCCFTTTSLVSAVYYLELLLCAGRVRLTDSSWRAAFVAAAIIAEKMHEDNFVHPVYIANSFSGKVSARVMAEMQNYIVFALDWDTTVPPAEFARIYQTAVQLGEPLLPYLPAQVFRERPVPAAAKSAELREELLAAQRSAALTAPLPLAAAASERTAEPEAAFQTPLRASCTWTESTASVSTMDADTPDARGRATPLGEQCPFLGHPPAQLAQ